MLQPKSPTYALLAVTEIARRQALSKDGVQASQLAETFNLPVAYLARILSLLAGAKILRSKRGPRGGFYMGKPARGVTVLNVIEAVGAVENLQGAIASVRAPRKMRQGLTNVFKQASDAAKKSLDSVTVEQLLGGQKRKKKR